jgi:hypothetical protein
LKPLPTKEESLREIQEEAARKTAELLAQRASRAESERQMRLDARAKFRQELRQVLALQGTDAGTEIDKLSHRYGYDVDMERYKLADEAWRFRRMSPKERVRYVRSLDLPETVILDFLSNDLHKQLNKRNGPRDEKEVRVRAAWMLLSYELPSEAAPASPRPGGTPGGARSTAPARRADQADAGPR